MTSDKPMRPQGTNLQPDGNRRGSFALVHVLAAGAEFIDVVLDDAGSDHGCGAEVEANGNFLEGGKVVAGPADGWVEDVVYEWDDDDDCEGVELGDDVVGDAIESHGCCL
jgi:hypothetical protein